MDERFKIVPDAEQWNQMIEYTGLERALPFQEKVGKLVKIKAFFKRKSYGIYNNSVLVKNVQINKYDISHLWIEVLEDRTWDELKEDQRIFVEGKVFEYYDSSNNLKCSLKECRLISEDEFLSNNYL